MLNTKDTERLTRVSCETLLTILETLPDALFFLDDSGTIVYANKSTQALTEATPEEIIGNLRSSPICSAMLSNILPMLRPSR